nr:hypothetical protein CFP56_69469 [Quercus suber]
MSNVNREIATRLTSMLPQLHGLLVRVILRGRVWRSVEDRVSCEVLCNCHSPRTSSFEKAKWDGCFLGVCKKEFEIRETKKITFGYCAKMRVWYCVVGACYRDSDG